MWHGSGMGIWMVLMTLVTSLIVLVPLAVAGYFILTASRTSASSGRTTAETLLAERYARGEIDEQEYRQRQTTLRTP